MPKLGELRIIEEAQIQGGGEGETITGEEVSSPVLNSPPLPPGASQTAPLSFQAPSPLPLKSGMKLRDILGEDEPPRPLEEQIRNSIMGPGGIAGPQSLGGILGGAAGTTLGAIGAGVGGIASAPVVFPVAGAVILGMAGKGLEKLWERNSEIDMNEDDWLKELGWAGVVEGTAEVVGGKVGGIFVRGTQQALAPYAKKITASKRALKEQAEKFKITLLAPQITGAKGPGKGIKFMGKLPFGAKLADRFAGMQNQQMDKAVKSLIRQIHPKYAQASSEMGLAVREGAEVSLEQAQNWSRDLFDGINQVIEPDTKFISPNIYEISSTIKEEELGLRGLLRNKAAGTAENLVNLTKKEPPAPTVGDFALFGNKPPVDLASTPAALVEELNLAAEDAKEMSLKRLTDLYTRLGSLTSRYKGTEAGRNFARMFKAVDEDLIEIGTKNDGLTEALTEARSFYKDRVIKDFLDNETFKNILRKDASLLAGTLLGPGVSIEEVKRIKKIVPTVTFEKLVAGSLWDLLAVRSRGPNGEFAVKKFINNISLEKYSVETLKEILGEDRYHALDSLRNLFLVVQKSKLGAGDLELTERAFMGDRQMEQLTRMGIRGAGSMATAGYLFKNSLDPVISASIAFLSPGQISKMIYSKRAAKIFSDGLKLGTTGKNRVFQSGRIPVMMGMSQVDWPFTEEIDTYLKTFPHFKQIEEASQPKMEIRTPQSQPILDPAQGVPVRIP